MNNLIKKTGITLFAGCCSEKRCLSLQVCSLQLVPTTTPTQKFLALGGNIPMSATARYSSLGKDGKTHVQTLSQGIIHRRFSSSFLWTCLLLGGIFLRLTWRCLFGMWIQNRCSLPWHLSVPLGMDGVRAADGWWVKSVVQLYQPKVREGDSHAKRTQQINKSI